MTGKSGAVVPSSGFEVLVGALPSVLLAVLPPVVEAVEGRAPEHCRRRRRRARRGRSR
ncbi:hypothetical protein [Nannocystis pusilla]|uniref:hypothetical protein n=1 Tax=Nannocystis pusilla TaxID=889268 RepID=UPI003B7A934C